MSLMRRDTHSSNQSESRSGQTKITASHLCVLRKGYQDNRRLDLAFSDILIRMTADDGYRAPIRTSDIRRKYKSVGFSGTYGAINFRISLNRRETSLVDSIFFYIQKYFFQKNESARNPIESSQNPFVTAPQKPQKTAILKNRHHLKRTSDSFCFGFSENILWHPDILQRSLFFNALDADLRYPLTTSSLFQNKYSNGKIIGVDGCA
ncbi:hypothetical protein [Acetobacter sp.]|uniref:hypothetical protein n=1 Tax=Acetobacter sp. TaxID=440 RepID=UPI0039E8A9BA